MAGRVHRRTRQRRDFRRNHWSQAPVNPLGPPLLALIAMAVFGFLYWIFGIGKRPFEYAIAAFVGYGGKFLLTVFVAGVIWGAIPHCRWISAWIAVQRAPRQEPSRNRRFKWVGQG
jgi:hypothetical protein